MKIAPISLALTGAAVAFLAIQLIRPARRNPSTIAERTLDTTVTVPPAVKAILVRSCNDCHSNQTHWPWYSSIAPISWLVIYDVNHGRRKMNFSDWTPRKGENPGDFTQRRLDDICSLAQGRSMPIPAYGVIHPKARLSDQDIGTLCGWTALEAPADKVR